MKPEIFRVYDIRGRYPNELNERDVFDIGRVLSERLRGGKIIVGHDGRLSSPTLFGAFCKGFGMKRVLDGGLMTTPMLYYLSKTLPVVGGVMVTASHNPKEINGLKMVDRNGDAISGLEVKKWMQQ